MATGIDHIVIAVHDLDTATRNYTAAGFTVIEGGEHKGGASKNVLVTFQDGAYLEIIAFPNPAAHTRNRWPQLLEQSEGLVDLALRTDDLNREVAALRDAGLNVHNPQDGGRHRPDGQRVDWQTLHFGENRTAALPFYCHDVTERSLRVPGGDAAVHANGVTGVAAIVIAVRDVGAASRDFAAISGDPGEEIASPVDGGGRARRFRVGPTAIELVEPGEGDSALRRYVEDRGELPYEFVLAAPGATGNALPLEQMHGTQIRLAS